MDKEILACMGLPSCNKEDDDFNDDDASVIEGEDIAGVRNAINLFIDEDDDLQICKLAFLLKKMFR